MVSLYGRIFGDVLAGLGAEVTTSYMLSHRSFSGAHDTAFGAPMDTPLRIGPSKSVTTAPTT